MEEKKKDPTPDEEKTRRKKNPKQKSEESAKLFSVEFCISRFINQPWATHFTPAAPAH